MPFNGRETKNDREKKTDQNRANDEQLVEGSAELRPTAFLLKLSLLISSLYK